MGTLEPVGAGGVGVKPPPVFCRNFCAPQCVCKMVVRFPGGGLGTATGQPSTVPRGVAGDRLPQGGEGQEGGGVYQIWYPRPLVCLSAFCSVAPPKISLPQTWNSPNAGGWPVLQTSTSCRRAALFVSTAAPTQRAAPDVFLPNDTHSPSITVASWRLTRVSHPSKTPVSPLTKSFLTLQPSSPIPLSNPSKPSSPSPTLPNPPLQPEVRRATPAPPHKKDKKCCDTFWCAKTRGGGAGHLAPSSPFNPPDLKKPCPPPPRTQHTRAVQCKAGQYHPWQCDAVQDRACSPARGRGLGSWPVVGLWAPNLF